jgi:hypothetical protein
LTEQGVENPYDKFSGWLKHFMCARSKLIEIGKITYYNQSTKEVVQRGLRESNQGSNEDESENDALSRALGTKEQRCRVHGVSSKLTWNESFPVYKLSYRKRKMVPSATVDIEEIKRQVSIQLLGDLRPIFESQGLPMSDIGAVGNEEKHRSSLASTTVAPNTKLADQAPAGSVPQENPLGATSGPSLEPDTIDTLAHPTPCRLIITISGDYRMEVGKGIIYPRMYTLDDVPIDSVSFVVVKVDMVHENAKNLNLEVAPNDTTLTLRDAVTRRVQRRRTSIDVDPAAISASTTPSLSQQHTIPSQSQPHTIPSLSPPQNTPSQSRAQTTPTMPQPQTTPTRSQQQPHALIIPKTRPELPLEDPPLPSPRQT